jgi:hypothetical protein
VAEIAALRQKLPELLTLMWQVTLWFTPPRAFIKGHGVPSLLRRRGRAPWLFRGGETSIIVWGFSDF